MKPAWALAAIACAFASEPITDPATARAFRNKYIATTNAWADGIEFTTAELAAMREGKKLEPVMWKGPDDPLANRVLAAGEPSFESMAALYPGKILDRTVLGAWSDPKAPLGQYTDEFAIYWNGAIAANLTRGRLTDRFGATAVQPLAFNTVVLFRAGPDGEMFGAVRRNYSSIGYEQGYLPIATAAYETGGVRYRQTAFADRPAGETGGWDIGYVRFEMTNVSNASRTAELRTEVTLTDGGKVIADGRRVLDASGAVLLRASDARRRFELRPGQSAGLYLKIPYVPDAKGLTGAATKSDFDAAHARVTAFWNGVLAKASQIDVPEPRLNNVWRALLLQNFVLADGPRFTYGSGTTTLRTRRKWVSPPTPSRCTVSKTTRTRSSPGSSA